MPRIIAIEAQWILRVTWHLGRVSRGALLALLFAMAGATATPAQAATSYIDNAGGTVTHQATGLIWKRCAEGQTWTGSTCSGTPTPYTWSQASALSGTVWRLPSVGELETIVDTTAYNPTINASAFPNAPSSPFWSNTSDPSNANNALYVNFIYGNTSTLNKVNTFLARLVSGTASTTGGGTAGGGTGTLSIVPSLALGWNLLGNSFDQPIAVATLFGDASSVNTVWKWDAAVSGWKFYSPSLSAAALQTYATSQGYGVLSTINPGEGFWVNAKINTTLAAQTGAPFSLTAANLVAGWNLAATADDISPSEFNRRLSVTPPTPGVVPNNLTTLWTWDNPSSNWYFYAPSLENNGTLTGYVASKGYLDFGQHNKTLGNGTGFWVNRTAMNLTIAPSLTLALELGGAAVTTLSNTGPTTVTATVLNDTGAAVPDVVVAFSSSDVSLATFSPATALTNAAGVASVEVNPASLSAAGSAIMTATTVVGGVTVSGSKGYTVKPVVVTSVPTLTLTFSNNAVLTNTQPVVVTATVKDATGAPVRGALVKLTNTGPTLASIDYSYYYYYRGSTSNTFEDYTNPAGVVTAALVPSLTTAGTGTIVASSVVDTTAVTDAKNYTVTAPSLTLALTVDGSAVTTLSNTQATTATATVRDAAGNPVANAVVGFSTANQALATFSPSTAQTDAAGVASVNVSPSSPTAAGAATMTASTIVGTTTVSSSMAYSVKPVIVTSQPSLTITFSNNAVLTSNQPVVVTATLKDATGAPVRGETVRLTNSSPTLASIDASYYYYYRGAASNFFEDVTNAAGIVTGNLVPSLTAAGTGTIIASSTVASTPVNDSKTYTVTAPSLSIALTSAGAPVTSLVAGGSANVDVTVRDAAGDPVANAVVAFSSSDTTLATFSPATALTAADGSASVVISPASTTAAGAATITANTQVGSATVTGTIGYAVVAAGTPTTAPSLSLTLSKTVLSTKSPALITATVTDANGIPVRTQVTFTNSDTELASVNYAYYSSYFSGQSTFTDYTDAAGVATGNLIPSLKTAGTATVVASAVVGSTTVTNSVSYTVTAPSLTVALTIGGTATTSVTTGTPVTATATLLDAAGTPVPGKVVTFETNLDLTAIAPATATALTDATGTASVTLSPASLTAAGAGTVTANSEIDNTPITGTIGYSVGAAVVTISPVSFGANPLSAFGTTSVTVTVYSNGIPVTTPQNVSFTSSCASGGKAALTASVTTLNGIATASYRDNGCAGDDTITASVSGIASSAGTLTITPPTTGSIRYVSATPASITLKGMGGAGRQESAQIIFKVVDTGGNPIGGKTVDFSLSTEAGGIALTTTTAISDPATGQVVVGVNSGAVSTPVRVIASTLSEGSTVTTQSDELSITTGIPDQDSFSLSATKSNIEGWNYDGETTTVTARLADHFNNPVPDGTSVVFMTEGGMIGDTLQPIKPVGSCTTVGSACSVTLTSQNPRVDGRVTVLAYAVGTESFTDLNGNGLADQLPVPIASAATGEMIDASGATTDMGEAFVDYNEDGIRDPLREPYVDFNGNASYDTPDGIINTMVCDHSAAAGSATACPTQQYRHVRDQLVVVFSTSTAVISINDGANIGLASCSPLTGAGASSSFKVTVVDQHGNAMPVGTKVEFSADNGTITSDKTYTVPNTIGCRTGYASCPASVGTATFGDIWVSMKSDATFTPGVAPAPGTCNDSAGSSGGFAVKVTTPRGNLSSSAITVTD